MNIIFHICIQDSVSLVKLCLVVHVNIQLKTVYLCMCHPFFVALRIVTFVRKFMIAGGFTQAQTVP